MKKIVKSYGSSLVITFSAEERKIHNIDEGDTIELSDIVIIKKKRVKRR